jgi:hypothetical protein
MGHGKCRQKRIALKIVLDAYYKGPHRTSSTKLHKSRRSHPYKRPVKSPKSAAPPSARTKKKSFIPSNSSAHNSPSESPEWDGWPDGDFSMLYSLSFVERHDNLHVHWATRPFGGRDGSTQAETWQEGKPTRRQCQGIIECENDNCFVAIRPQSRPAGIAKQLAQGCDCGAKLVHQTCNVRSTLHTFSGGVYYQNGGTHDHPRPTV